MAATGQTVSNPTTARCQHRDCAYSKQGILFSDRFAFCPKCHRCMVEGLLAELLTQWWLQFFSLSALFALFMLKIIWPAVAFLLVACFIAVAFLFHAKENTRGGLLFVLFGASLATLLGVISIHYQWIWFLVLVLSLFFVHVNRYSSAYQWRWWSTLFVFAVTSLGSELLVFRWLYATVASGENELLVNDTFFISQHYYQIALVLWWWIARGFLVSTLGDAVTSRFDRIRSLEIHNIIPDPPHIQQYPPIDWTPESKLSAIQNQLLRIACAPFLISLHVLTRISIAAANHIKTFFYWVIFISARILDWSLRSL